MNHMWLLWLLAPLCAVWAAAIAAAKRRAWGWYLLLGLLLGPLMLFIAIGMPVRRRRYPRRSSASIRS